MTVLIDEAVWPAHGTVWAHLVSDVDYEELHAFAERAGIPRRAFDHDHYDVPERRREELIALGATPVTGRELLRRLQAAGLRVRQRDKSRPHLPATPPSG
jgi:transposase